MPFKSKWTQNCCIKNIYVYLRRYSVSYLSYQVKWLFMPLIKLFLKIPKHFRHHLKTEQILKMLDYSTVCYKKVQTVQICFTLVHCICNSVFTQLHIAVCLTGEKKMALNLFFSFLIRREVWVHHSRSSWISSRIKINIHIS